MRPPAAGTIEQNAPPLNGRLDFILDKYFPTGFAALEGSQMMRVHAYAISRPCLFSALKAKPTAKVLVPQEAWQSGEFYSIRLQALTGCLRPHVACHESRSSTEFFLAQLLCRSPTGTELGQLWHATLPTHHARIWMDGSDDDDAQMAMTQDAQLSPPVSGVRGGSVADSDSSSYAVLLPLSSTPCSPA